VSRTPSRRCPCQRGFDNSTMRSFMDLRRRSHISEERTCGIKCQETDKHMDIEVSDPGGSLNPQTASAIGFLGASSALESGPFRRLYRGLCGPISLWQVLRGKPGRHCWWVGGDKFEGRSGTERLGKRVGSMRGRTIIRLSAAPGPEHRRSSLPAASRNNMLCRTMARVHLGARLKMNSLSVSPNFVDAGTPDGPLS
jgi:hypothetical protein